MRGLYIHLPFCKSRCHYCNFISLSNPDTQLRSHVLGCLTHEMNEAKKRYGRLKFNTVYFGGGSPSILSIHEMTELVKKIHESFEIEPDAEMTCEWNPDDGDDQKIPVFKALGINRISLGVQSFSDELLIRLGRRHSTYETLFTFEKIQEAGIFNISVDLMLRLPGQTLRDFQESLEKVIELEVPQVSLYDLEVHDNTVFGQLQKTKKLDLPNEEEHAAMYEAAIHMLTGASYEHYEISNFAKPGLASRHNLIYWHNQEYLGLGPGAFSYLQGVRYQFAPNLESYLQKCETGDWANDMEETLSAEEKETESFVTGLRLREGVEPERFKRIYPVLKKRIEDLLKEGLLEKAEKTVRLTNRGKFLSEDVFSFLLHKEMK